MQYQLVLILFNIVIGLAAYFFLRGRRQLFRLIIMPVVYAYFLAAFLPYLLAYVPVNWVIAFYSVAVLLGFLAKGIDSRVQPDVETEYAEEEALSDADLDYMEIRSEREALLNAFQFSRSPSDDYKPLLSRISSGSTASVKESTPSVSFAASRPDLKSSFLDNISQPDNASSSDRSNDFSDEKPVDDDNNREITGTPSDSYIKEAPEIVDETLRPSIASIHPLPQQDEKPAHKSTYVLRDHDVDRQMEEDSASAEPASTPHATVSYLSDYKEEKAALAQEEKPQTARATPLLKEAPLQAAAEIELNKKAVEEIAQKFAFKIKNGHKEESNPAQEPEAPLISASLSDAGEDQISDKEDHNRYEELEIPVVTSHTDPGQERFTLVEETLDIQQEPVVIDESYKSPLQFTAAMSEAPAERRLELVEAARNPHPEENKPEIFEGVATLPTNQQIPVEDAGEMVLGKESINDQQEAVEDDLMQLDLALVIDRAFQAKFSSDYQKAIRIFEVALNRTPSPKLAQMIADDIEVMRSKLA